LLVDNSKGEGSKVETSKIEKPKDIILYKSNTGNPPSTNTSIIQNSSEVTEKSKRNNYTIRKNESTSGLEKETKFPKIVSKENQVSFLSLNKS